MSYFKERIFNIVKKYGVLGTIIRIFQKPFRLFLDCIKYSFFNYNYVFKYDPKTAPLPVPDGFTVKHFDKIENIPLELLMVLKSDIGEQTIEINTQLIKNKGCCLWVAFLWSEPACTILSRNSSVIPYWFITLHEGDHVLFRANTAEKHRGKGIYTSLLQYIAAQLHKGNIGIYGDCSIHNKPSKKGFLRSGFKMIAKKKPIEEK